MKNIIDLEGRWRSYRYRSLVFYVFVFVLFVFIVFVILLIRFQYDRYYKSQVAQEIDMSSTYHSNDVVDSLEPISDANALLPIENYVITSHSNDDISTPITNIDNPTVNFICRKVIADRLTVRSKASFRSNPVGYYSRGGIFCAEDNVKNGLLKINHGWISASNSYSHVVDVNMFVDYGFNKDTYITNVANNIKKTEFEETDFTKDDQSPFSPIVSDSIVSPGSSAVVVDDKLSNSPVIATNGNYIKPSINISSEKITKEREIELKIADFKISNDYNVAIEIAEYYFDMKDYVNSIRWSLNASESDSKGKTKSKSFIIYAKSLYASGKREQAIDVLNKYIAKTNSREAMEALKNIRQGII